ncbi:MAG: VIT1/CCC1 family protein [Treponema sp.]|jgi:VIT1/CCC1 family predicted Fe2+/Mn2+ transporter|nr:VIT1/CCC1 family protein [Treponema sp.]
MINDKILLKTALKIQCREINEHHVYIRLAKLCKDPRNAEVLRRAGEAERRHAAFWKTKTGIEVQPRRLYVFFTLFLARLLGLTFTLKRMEKNEGTASKIYMELIEYFPEVKPISIEEAAHEKALLDMLDEEMLQYIGSIVLGLNDALIELTGALAGFTLALGSTVIISLAGLVTGISAAFSMAASDYLSSKAENNPRAARSALYTGGAYIITVIFLILPFLLLSSKFIALGITMAAAVFIIFIFNYYLATAKDLNFKRRFIEMTLISLGVAGLSFAIGWVLKIVLGVDA